MAVDINHATFKEPEYMDVEHTKLHDVYLTKEGNLVIRLLDAYLIQGSSGFRVVKRDNLGRLPSIFVRRAPITTSVKFQNKE